MARHAILLIALLVFADAANAHSWAPPTLDNVAGSDSVYLVRVIPSIAHHQFLSSSVSRLIPISS